jgi:cytochrome b subunit of formate dehydrogenase
MLIAYHVLKNHFMKTTPHAPIYNQQKILGHLLLLIIIDFVSLVCGVIIFASVYRFIIAIRSIRQRQVVHIFSFSFSPLSFIGFGVSND